MQAVIENKIHYRFFFNCGSHKKTTREYRYHRKKASLKAFHCPYIFVLIFLLFCFTCFTSVIKG